MIFVKDLMTIDPDVVFPHSSLREVIATMNKCNCRQLPVVDDDELIGIITDRDVRLAVNSPIINNEPLQRLAILDEVTAAECMTTNPMSISPDAPLYEAAGLLANYKYGALLVVKEDKLVGIITVTDLLNQLALKPEPTG